MKKDFVWIITYNFDGNISTDAASSKEVAHRLISKELARLIKDGSYTGEVAKFISDNWNDIDYVIDRIAEYTDYADRIYCEQHSIKGV